MACFALLAFLLQGFALQTHVHPLTPPLAKVTAEQATGTKLPAPLKILDPQDQGACRLCQELVQAGSALAPAGLAVAAPLTFAATVFLDRFAGPDQPAPGFAWQSRAPPRH